MGFRIFRSRLADVVEGCPLAASLRAERRGRSGAGKWTDVVERGGEWWRVGADPTLAVDDLADVLGDSQPSEALRGKNLAGMIGGIDVIVVMAIPPSVIVDDLDVLRPCRGPAEADAPLLVDPLY